MVGASLLRARRRALTALLLCAVTAASAQTPSEAARDLAPRQEATEAGTGAVRGRIIRSDTGQPVRRVEVALRPENYTGPADGIRSAVTGVDGRYEFAGVADGRYQVHAVRGGYVEAWFGQRRPLEPRESIEVVNGRPVEDVDIALVRTGAISGQVIDLDGEPLVGVAVRVLRIGHVNGVPAPEPIGTAANVTDDLGQFRVSGLSPGEYFVAAQADARSSNPASLELLTTYFPGTGSMSDASRLRVGPGQDLSGIAFPMLRSKPATIAGIVVDPNFRPIGGGLVMWSLRTLSGASGSSATVGMDGRFTIPGRAPGDYRITASVSAADGRSHAAVDVTLSGEDVTDLVLMPKRDVSLRGRVTFEDGSTPTGLRASDLRILGHVVNDSWRNWTTLRPALDEDWTFSGTVTAGSQWVLRVATPEGWTTKSIRAGSVDITDAAFDLSADVRDVEIVLTPRVTLVSGAVRDDQGRPAGFSTVVVADDDPEKWGPYTRFVQRTRTDAAGRFSIQGLPPGRYFAVALDYLEDGAEGDRELLAHLRERGTPLVLAEAESPEVDLTVVDAP